MKIGSRRSYGRKIPSGINSLIESKEEEIPFLYCVSSEF